MRLLTHVLLTVIFLLTTAMRCEEDSDDNRINYNLVDVKLLNLDYSGEKIIESDQPIKNNAYVIGVKYITQEVIPTPSLYNGNNNVEWTHQTVDNVASKPKIYSIKDFNAEHPAGSDVSEYFTISREGMFGYSLLLVLNEAPSPGTYSFNVHFDCTNDTIVTRNTQPVTLY